MGLDVYLRWYDDYEVAKAKRDAYEKRSEEIWAGDKPFNELSDDEKIQKRTEIDLLCTELGVDGHGEAPGRRKIEINSSLYPDHLFKIGYFRSSYNESGFDSVMSTICGCPLRDIFDPPEEYEFQPDWESARDRAQEALDRARQNIAETGSFRVRPFFEFIDSQHDVKTPEEAMQVFRDEKRKEQKTSFDYSSRVGSFFFANPMEVHAVIKGTMYDKTAYFVVYKDSEIEWYLQALEIIVETCEWVLNQQDVDKYYLSWSG